ncbi:MAG TPA: type IV pilin protein [Rhodocyclaceae bacterium]
MTRNYSKPAQRAAGFTLIELLVAVVVVGILAAVAWPSYQDSMRKSHRADAQALLMDIAQQEQRYFLDARAYAPMATLNPTIPTSVSNYYDTPVVTIPAGATPPTFSISIAPTATGSQAGDSCGTLTLDSSGNKTSSSGSNCW